MSSLTLLIFSSNNLFIHATLAISLSLFLSFLRIPSLLLYGLHTYIHPDDVNPNPKSSGLRPAIRRPIDSEPQLKPRKQSKERFEFDENKAQIFRLKLTEGHIESRIYYKEFFGAFNSTFIALSSLLLHGFLQFDKDLGFVRNGTVIPLLLGFVGVARLMFLIVRVGFEKSASKKMDRQLSFGFGIIGFLFSFGVVYEVGLTRVVDFQFRGSLNGFGKFLFAVFMGLTVCLLYIPALRNARSFWLGTDQIRCNLSIISCGWFSWMLLYASYVSVVFTSLLWISPLADFLVKGNNTSGGQGLGLFAGARVNGMELIGQVGMPKVNFDQVRIWFLMVTGILQVLALRGNVQMFLNEAVLCWYQRLHASKVPDMDYSRAKVFLHNHYICLVVLQFFTPGTLVLLLLGFSKLDYDFLTGMVDNVSPNTDLVKEAIFFMAWWIVFVWAVFSTATLALYRWGILYVS